ncbi:M14 family zinc carboxypeptidase [Winogradskyella maritima]|uniref:M14 family zinc carboxypeptidase n=1 Tax=Winogradskyella maritima TaxID=1517766 RepID=A0ABV8AFU9_9FLAO
MKRVEITGVNQRTIKTLNDLGIDMTCGVTIENNTMSLELMEFELENIKRNGVQYRVMIDDLTKFYSNRAIADLDNASALIRQEKNISLNSRSLSVSELLGNVGQYNDCDEIDWATPQNWNINDATNYPSETNHFGGCLTYDMVIDELDAMRAYSVANGLNIISEKLDASYNSSTKTTIEGRPIYYLRISDNPDTDEANEPETLYQSLIHSREAATVMNQLFFMWYILENYNSDVAIRNLVNNHELYFIPVLNPDGFVYNQTVAPDGGGGQRKNRNLTNAGGCGTYSSGIDLNRNSEYFWNNGGSSNSECDATFMGDSPFSEPETQILRDFFLDHDFEIALNHHSFKNAMLHAYAGVDRIPGTSTPFPNSRADEYSKYNHDMTHYNRYAHGPSTYISSLNSGNMNDWMLGGADYTYTTNQSPIVSRQSGTGSGKNTMAWTPENGLSSEGTGGTYGGFWPQPSNYLPIAKRAMRMNFLAAYFSGKYAKLHDLNQNDITTTTGNFQFAIENLGQAASDFTITITPVSSNVSFTTSTFMESFTDAQVLEQRIVSIPYTLSGVNANDEIEFKVTFTNNYATDNVLYEANITKAYNPTVIFSENADPSSLSNWTSSGSWTTTTDAYSGSSAIASNSGSYSTNQNRTLQLTNPLDFSSSSTVLVQYHAKWDLERSFDYVAIEASTNGSTWTQLCGKLTKPGAPTANNTYSSTSSGIDTTVKSGTDDSNQNAISYLYDGDTQDRWNMEEILIDASSNSSLIGQNTVYLRFRLDTDSSNRQDSYENADFTGFKFDNFKVLNIQIPCDASNPPTNLNVFNITSTTADITWDVIPSATYDLQYREVGGSFTTINNISTNSYTINTGLSASTDYQVQISTRCVSTTSAFSSLVDFTTAAPCSGTLVDTFPYSESFEGSGSGSLGDWTQDSSDNFDWTLDANGTPTTSTGPSSALEGNYYLYTEAGTSTGIARIISPCFDLNGLSSASFSYAYHMYGSNMGSLTLEISDDDGATWTNLWSQSGNQGDSWFTNNIDLSTYLNKYVKFRFSGDMPNSGNSRSDMAIDDIGLTAVISSITPVADCMDITIQLDSSGNASITPNDIDNGGSAGDLSIDISSFTCSDIGTVDVTLTATDPSNSGNTDSCIATVTVESNTTWYLDTDGDNFAVSSTQSCTSPGAGYTTTVLPLTDCDDSNADEFPGQTWYIDADSDGYGTNQTTACERPTNGFLASELTGTSDCDDGNNGINAPITYFEDNDGDGFGSTTSMDFCQTTAPAGYSTNNTDCDDSDADEFPGQTWYIDADGDGYGTNQTTACERPTNGFLASELTGTSDCDDGNNGINAPITYFEDNDGDGFGSTTSMDFCQTTAPAGYSTNNTDCDDSDADEFPGQTWYIDTDSDGYGTNQTTACERPTNGFLASELTGTSDCDDGNASINAPITYFEDNDGDGFGSTTSMDFCQTTAPAGYSTNNTDCDDSDADEFPGQTWYIDADGDGYGTNQTTACERPTNGFLASELTGTSDCDDGNASINAPITYFEDNDGDGFGSTTSMDFCQTTAPAGYSTNNTDCDDSDADEFPGQTWYIDADGDDYGTNQTTACERPTNGFLASELTGTSDCDDGNASINAPITYYEDNDGDGFGSTTSMDFCQTTAPAGYSTNNTDCDDSDADEFPGQTWYIDADGDGYGTNQTTACERPTNGFLASELTGTSDCDDGNASINAPITYYEDNDGDGFGSTTSMDFCQTTAPAGYSTNNTDCDDSDADEFPGQTWYIDADGDGYGTNQTTACERPTNGFLASELTGTSDCDDGNNGINAPITYYEDNDGDGFGSTTSMDFCQTTAPAGYSTNNTDCDDSDADEFPGQTWYIDADGDGYGTNQTTACERPTNGFLASELTGTSDCDDNNNGINAPITYYEDNDGDGFGSTTSADFCQTTAPAGYSTNNTDCDDSDADEFPGQIWYIDADGDGYGTNQTTACERPTNGFLASELTGTGTDDCDDANPSKNPGAIDIPDNGVDEDCDGQDNVTLNTKDSEFNFLSVYPNPFKDVLKVKIPNAFIGDDLDFKIFDINGRVVYHREIQATSSFSLDGLKHMEQAPYILKITNQTSGEQLIKRLIKN